MTKRLHIVRAANERGFSVVLDEQEVSGARLGGYLLDFPVVHVKHAGADLSFEISWDLAERLANGTTNRVVY